MSEFFRQLTEQLDAIDGRTVTVTQEVAGSSLDSLTDEDIDRIHEGLLRKQRAGSLGLNE